MGNVCSMKQRQLSFEARDVESESSHFCYVTAESDELQMFQQSALSSLGGYCVRHTDSLKQMQACDYGRALEYGSDHFRTLFSAFCNREISLIKSQFCLYILQIFHTKHSMNI
jgi:hypothetical protein